MGRQDTLVEPAQDRGERLALLIGQDEPMHLAAHDEPAAVRRRGRAMSRLLDRTALTIASGSYSRYTGTALDQRRWNRRPQHMLDAQGIKVQHRALDKRCAQINGKKPHVSHSHAT